MVSFEIKKFLWHYDEAKGFDKIWFVVDVEGKMYNGWGRRADLDGKKKLTFRFWPGRWGEADAMDKAREKMRKGYKEVDSSSSGDEYPGIEACYPNFVKSFQNQLVLAKLSARIMNAN